MKKPCTCWRRCQGVPGSNRDESCGPPYPLGPISSDALVFFGSTDVRHPSIPSLFPWFLSDCCCDHFRSSKNFTPTIDVSCLKKNLCSLLPKERWGHRPWQWCLLQAQASCHSRKECRCAITSTSSTTSVHGCRVPRCLDSVVKNHLRFFFALHIYIDSPGERPV